MKVYIVIGGWNYEGYGEPNGVFSTKEKAEECLKFVKKRYDYAEIMEYTINHIEE